MLKENSLIKLDVFLSFLLLILVHIKELADTIKKHFGHYKKDFQAEYILTIKI